jgi:hypothetical protein
VPNARSRVSRQRTGPTPFSSVLDWVGRERPTGGTQDEKRHYSERFSQDVAEWVAGYFYDNPALHKVLPPEAPVPTAFGKKRLDVGAVDEQGYLVLDVSIKTFNFTDPRSKNYKKNFTGRFYELLGEAMDIHGTYPHSVMVALVLLPVDGCLDGRRLAPSSFGSAVKQYWKIAGRECHTGENVRFEKVYVGVHSPDGTIFFFDAENPPPKNGLPPDTWRLSMEGMIEEVLRIVELREAGRTRSKAELETPFLWYGKSVDS